MYILPKYYFPSSSGKPTPGGGVRAKPHRNPKVQNGYMKALGKLVPDREECANLRLELSRYFTSTRVFGSLHTMEDRDRFDAITWWDAYVSQGLLPKLAKKCSRRLLIILLLRGIGAPAASSIMREEIDSLKTG